MGARLGRSAALSVIIDALLSETRGELLFEARPREDASADPQSPLVLFPGQPKPPRQFGQGCFGSGRTIRTGGLFR